MRNQVNAIRGSVIAMMSLVVALSLLLVAAGSPGWAGPSGKDKILIGKKEKMTTTDPIVEMETTKGTIKIQVYKQEAPITANNFLDLVQRGFYNGLTFHRYEPGFVIQGGDPRGDGTGGFIDPQTKAERRIPLEVKPNLKHDAAGMVAMARSSDPNSASCQFYITLAPASFLDMQYAVFGKVVDGLPAALQLRKGDKINSAKVLEAASK